LLALVQLARLGGAIAAFDFLSSPAGSIHVEPMKADERKENTMTIFDFALLADAVARLLGAVAGLLRAVRRR